jgi:hypothetical protein
MYKIQDWFESKMMTLGQEEDDEIPELLRDGDDGSDMMKTKKKLQRY